MGTLQGTADVLSQSGTSSAKANSTADGGIGSSDIKDPDFVDKALNEMHGRGGSTGKMVARAYRDPETRIVYDRRVSLGEGRMVLKSWKDKLFGSLFFEPEYVAQVKLNPWNIQSNSYKASVWQQGGIDPNDYITKTVEILYHESGHIWGLYDANMTLIGPSYYSPSVLDHTGYHDVWDDRIGGQTWMWLRQNSFVSGNRVPFNPYIVR